MTADESIPSGEEGIRREWDRRSVLWGASLRGVLFKGLPEALNAHIHRWHVRTLLDFLTPLASLDRPRVLDVGCGYGRLTTAVSQAFPNAELEGVDLSENYVRLYRETTGRPARVGSIDRLPPTGAPFDAILCVTVLMYVPPERLAAALGALMERLKTGGRLVLIESHASGAPFLTAFGLLSAWRRRRPTPVDTGGRAFRSRDFDAAIRAAGARVETRRRMPVTTMLSLPLAAACAVLPRSVARAALPLLEPFDRMLGRIRLPTHYLALCIVKP